MCMFLFRVLLKLIRAISSCRRTRCSRAFDSHVKQHAITSSQVMRPDDQKMHFSRNVIWIIQSRVASACNTKRNEGSHNNSNLKCSGETKWEKRKSSQRSLWFCLSLHLFSIQMHLFDKVLTTVGCCLHSVMNMKAIGWVSLAYNKDWK